MNQLAEWLDRLKGSHIPARIIPSGSSGKDGSFPDCQIDCDGDCIE